MTIMSLYPADIKSGSGTFLIRKVFSEKRLAKGNLSRCFKDASSREYEGAGDGQAVHVLRHKTKSTMKRWQERKERMRKRRGLKKQQERGGGVYYVR